MFILNISRSAMTNTTPGVSFLYPHARHMPFTIVKAKIDLDIPLGYAFDSLTRCHVKSSKTVSSMLSLVACLGQSRSGTTRTTCMII
jgi:hypothetical protein